MIICLTSLLCAITTEAVHYHYFTLQLSKQSPKLNINVFHNLQVFSVTIPLWVLAPQFLIQGLAECLVFITST